jgi:hypothetical protein
MDQLAQTYPGLANYLKRFSIDPVTGKLPTDNAWNTTAVKPPKSGRGNPKHPRNT